MMLICAVCSKIFPHHKIKRYIDHYRSHSNIPNIKFPCGFSTCPKTFRTHNAFRTHMYRNHKFHTSNVEITQNLTCSVGTCLKEFHFMGELKKHLKKHIQSGITINCPYESCSRQYSHYSSFCSHVSRIHKKQYSYCNQLPTTTNNLIPTLDDESADCQQCSDIEIETNNDINNRIKDLSQFYLKLQCKHNIPASTIQIIVDELSKFCDTQKDNILQSVLSAIDNITIDQISKDKIINAINADTLSYVNETLRSDFLRKKFFKQNFHFVQPVTLKLGLNEKNQQCIFHYIPIHETLKALLNDKSVLEQFSNPISEETGLLCDFTDGSVYKSNQLFKQNLNALQLILYQDSYEIVNPLGSSRTKHKILAMYMTLGNIYKFNRSKANPIQLVLLCKEKHLKYFGHEAVFRHLIKDLKELEVSGLIVNNNVYKGTVAYIAGDNLGSHNIGGFTESFAHGHICRFCEIKYDEFQNSPLLKETARTEMSYDATVHLLQTSDLQSVCGIKFNSIFNELAFYHVCSPGLPPCLGHDIFEGVVAYDVHLFIKYFIKTKKWFTLKYLNNAIDKFPYKGEDAKNKPNTISLNSDKLSGHAIQNWTLLRFLSIYLRYKIINQGDPVWQLFCILQEIVILICSSKISHTQIAYLNTLIEDYLHHRQILFPTTLLRPKHHYMSHYPELILQFGPLIWVWTMRFESKHTFFKKCIRNTKNFINVTSTLAERHELYQAYLRSGLYFSDPISMEHFSSLIFSCFDVQTVNALKKYFASDENLYFAHKMLFNDTLIKASQGIAIQVEVIKIKIGIIQFLLLHKGKLFFVIKTFNCYKIPNFSLYSFDDKDDVCSEHSPILCIDFQNIIGFPFQIYDIGLKKVIIPKQNLHYNFLK